MDTILQELPNSMNRFQFEHHGPISFSSNRNLLNGYENHNSSDSFPPFYSFNPQPPDNHSTSPPSSSTLSSEGNDPSNNALLKYISDMLMDEDLEGKTCMLQDCLALQAAEKSLYDALGQEYPHSSTQGCQNIDSPDDNSHWSSNAAMTSLENLNGVCDLDLYGMQSSVVDSPPSPITGSHFCGEVQRLEEDGEGIGDVSKFISDCDSLVLDPKSISLTSSDKEDREYSPNGSRGRKSHQREGSDDLEEERSNKHSALSLAESEQSDMFDDVLLCRFEHSKPGSCSDHGKSVNGGNGNGQIKGSNGRTTRGRRQGKREVVDLSSLLTQCAQSVAIGDQRTATELLKQTRQHSSPYGDANQRVANYFADALETRMAGTKTPTYSPLLSNKTPVSDILKGYQVYIKASPFYRMSNFFANQTIFKVAQTATSLHIIDFGILYGFQWPCLIQRLSQRPGGPPKLRITGIELPQPGFRPAERVEETGLRLKRYCERFQVPFDYHVIAQKWETIKYEDLNIDGDEMTVVNCLYRLRNIPDDTVVSDSARDAVLNLIRSIKPRMFIHGVVNGTYNAPFFVTRFREALYHFSSLFDMFEVNVPCEDEQRRLFEKEIYGRDIMNVIACEGQERVERPETYRQWQARNTRVGFRQLPLDQEILKRTRCTVRSGYHKDFVVDETGQWMLQGWKGRVVYALSIWQPVYE